MLQIVHYLSRPRQQRKTACLYFLSLCQSHHHQLQMSLSLLGPLITILHSSQSIASMTPVYFPSLPPSLPSSWCPDYQVRRPTWLHPASSRRLVTIELLIMTGHPRNHHTPIPPTHYLLLFVCSVCENIYMLPLWLLYEYHVHLLNYMMCSSFLLMLVVCGCAHAYTQVY